MSLKVTEKGEDPQRHRREETMKTETEIGVICLQIKVYQRFLAATETRREA